MLVQLGGQCLIKKWQKWQTIVAIRIGLEAETSAQARALETPC